MDQHKRCGGGNTGRISTIKPSRLQRPKILRVSISGDLTDSPGERERRNKPGNHGAVARTRACFETAFGVTLSRSFVRLEWRLAPPQRLWKQRGLDKGNPPHSFMLVFVSQTSSQGAPSGSGVRRHESTSFATSVRPSLVRTTPARKPRTEWAAGRLP
jgi:hypothetical protein